VKKADKPNVVIIGDDNEVSIGGTNLLPIAIAVFALGALAIAVLAISLCCPELLADFVRWIIGTAISS
jgi:hypothetical protein